METQPDFEPIAERENLNRFSKEEPSVEKVSKEDQATEREDNNASRETYFSGLISRLHFFGALGKE